MFYKVGETLILNILWVPLNRFDFNIMTCFCARYVKESHNPCQAKLSPPYPIFTCSRLGADWSGCVLYHTTSVSFLRLLGHRGLHSWNRSYGLCLGSGSGGSRSGDGCMRVVNLLRKSLFVANQTAHTVTPGPHGSNNTHLFRLYLVTCNILITIGTVIGPWVACNLPSNPKQILLAKKKR